MKKRYVAIVSMLVVSSLLVGVRVSDQDIIKEKPKKVIKKVYYKIPLSMELQDFTRGICKAQNIEFETMLSVMAIESDFNQNCSSRNNGERTCSKGICQLNENGIKWYREITYLGNKFDINNVYHNIFAGVLVLKSCRNDWESIGYTGEKLEKLMLLSYNRGTGGARRYSQNNNINNNDYVRKVIKYKEVLSKCKVIVNIIDTKD